MHFSFAILVVLAVSVVQADTCTKDDLAMIQRAYASAENDGKAACPDTTKETDYCSNNDCLNYIMNMLYELPDCTTDGVNVKESLQAAYDFCQAVDAGVSTMSSGLVSDTSSGSAATTSSSANEDSTNTSDSTANDSTSGTSDQANADTPAPEAGGSSGSSDATTAVALTTAVLAMTAFTFAAVL
ncbi:hypothetical protein PHYBOEH_009630 [Phytophthora boehmeriae]|uniref:Elicitin n=1 Tax=Phytophthora boehmeriae TaxID=109152 RepID=A0A8T1VW48_9STRA|nr:hypothetical protein PHYBOEH_009630 [Phytophthora boehmeriae]